MLFKGFVVFFFLFNYFPPSFYEEKLFSWWKRIDRTLLPYDRDGKLDIKRHLHKLDVDCFDPLKNSN